MKPISSVDVETLARLSLVTHALTGELSPAELVDIVVRQEMAELDANGGLVALLGADAELVPLATFGYSTTVMDGIGRLTADRDLPLVVAARDRQPIFISTRADGEARFPELAGVAPASQAWAAVPLIANGLVIGALGVSFVTPRPFTEAERLFVRALADVAALAVAAHPSWPDRVGVVDRPTHRAEIALLDLDGVIVAVNETWEEFCRVNGGDIGACGVGASYLDVCERAVDAPDAVAAAEAIRHALALSGPAVSTHRFSCDAPTEPRRFDLLVSARHDDGRHVGATVVLTHVHDERGAVLADVLASLHATERELDQQRSMNERLERALARKVVIEQAKGMLAGERGITIDQAFEALRRHARRNRTPLDGVADAVVSLGLRLPVDDADPAAAVQPAALGNQHDAAERDVALGAMSDVFRVGLALAPLVDGDAVGQYASEVVASIDQLVVDIRGAATGRYATVDELLGRARQYLTRIAPRLEQLARQEAVDEMRARLLVEAAELARGAAVRLSEAESTGPLGPGPIAP